MERRIVLERPSRIDAGLEPIVVREFMNEYLQVTEKALTLCNLILASPSYGRNYKERVDAAINAIELRNSVMEQTEFQSVMVAVKACADSPLANSGRFRDIYFLLNLLQVWFYPSLMEKIQRIQNSVLKGEKRAAKFCRIASGLEFLIGALLSYLAVTRGSMFSLCSLVLYIVAAVTMTVHINSKIQQHEVNIHEIERRTRFILSDLQSLERCVVNQSHEAEGITRALQLASRQDSVEDIQVVLPRVKAGFDRLVSNPLKVQATLLAQRVGWARHVFADFTQVI